MTRLADVKVDASTTISVRSSLHITDAEVAALDTLVGSRNRFVCLQLVTMVKEQHAKNLAAATSGDTVALQQAELVFVATISVRGQLVGGALFYPRLPKELQASPQQDSVRQQQQQPIQHTISLSVRAGPIPDATADTMAQGGSLQLGYPSDPRDIGRTHAAAGALDLWKAPVKSHVYVELICVNTPGKGYGALLLSHVEQFVRINAQLVEQQYPHYGVITGIKLLSVSSAQGFYSKLGYNAVPGHKLAESRAAAGALVDPAVDWGALDAIGAAVAQERQLSSLAALLEGLEAELAKLVQQARLPNLPTALFAFAAHEMGRLSAQGSDHVECLGQAFQIVMELWGWWQDWGQPLPDGKAALSTAAVNLGFALVRECVVYDTEGVTSAACAAQLRGRHHWDDLRDAVWELVAFCFGLLKYAGHCSGRPARADWQALVRPALLLMSLHKQLLQGVDLQHTEADALKPLDWPLAMEGLVALQQKLTEWYYPLADTRASSLGIAAAARQSRARAHLDALKVQLDKKTKDLAHFVGELSELVEMYASIFAEDGAEASRPGTQHGTRGRQRPQPQQEHGGTQQQQQRRRQQQQQQQQEGGNVERDPPKDPTGEACQRQPEGLEGGKEEQLLARLRCVLARVRTWQEHQGRVAGSGRRGRDVPAAQAAAIAAMCLPEGAAQAWADDARGDAAAAAAHWAIDGLQAGCQAGPKLRGGPAQAAAAPAPEVADGAAGAQAGGPAAGDGSDKEGEEHLGSLQGQKPLLEQKLQQEGLRVLLAEMEPLLQWAEAQGWAKSDSEPRAVYAWSVLVLLRGTYKTCHQQLASLEQQGSFEEADQLGTSRAQPYDEGEEHLSQGCKQQQAQHAPAPPQEERYESHESCGKRSLPEQQGGSQGLAAGQLDPASVSPKAKAEQQQQLAEPGKGQRQQQQQQREDQPGNIAGPVDDGGAPRCNGSARQGVGGADSAEGAPAVDQGEVVVPREQVGRALRETATLVTVLLRSDLQPACYISGGGIEAASLVLSCYAEELQRQREEQQQEKQQQENQQQVARQQQQQQQPQQVEGKGEGRCQGGSTHAAGDMARSAAITCEVLEGLWQALRGPYQEDARDACVGEGVVIALLDCLDAIPPLSELAEECLQGSHLAWRTSRKLLRLLEAVILGRDHCKEHFLEHDGFATVWRTVADLEALDQEEQEGLKARCPGVVRGLVGNALSVLSAAAACNYDDEGQAAVERQRDIAQRLARVTSLEVLLRLAETWQPGGYDELQATLEADQASCACSLHAAAFRLAAALGGDFATQQLAPLESDRQLLGVVVQGLGLPEEPGGLNDRSVLSAIALLNALLKEKPLVAPAVMSAGALEPLLRLLGNHFKSAMEAEAKLQASMRMGRGRRRNPPAAALNKPAMELYTLTVGLHWPLISLGSILLAALLQAEQLASLVEGRQLEPLAKLLRKTVSFTSQEVQSSWRVVAQAIKLAQDIIGIKARMATVSDGVKAQQQAAKTAQELVEAEEAQKGKAASKAAKRERQRAKQRQREEQQQHTAKEDPGRVSAATEAAAAAMAAGEKQGASETAAACKAKAEAAPPGLELPQGSCEVAELSNESGTGVAALGQDAQRAQQPGQAEHGPRPSGSSSDSSSSDSGWGTASGSAAGISGAAWSHDSHADAGGAGGSSSRSDGGSEEAAGGDERASTPQPGTPAGSAPVIAPPLSPEWGSHVLAGPDFAKPSTAASNGTLAGVDGGPPTAGPSAASAAAASQAALLSHRLPPTSMPGQFTSGGSSSSSGCVMGALQGHARTQADEHPAVATNLTLKPAVTSQPPSTATTSNPSQAGQIKDPDAEFEALMGFLLPGITLTGSAPPSPLPQAKQRPPPQPRQQAALVSTPSVPLPLEALQQQAPPLQHSASQQQTGSDAGSGYSTARGNPDPALLAALHCPLTGRLLKDPVLTADGYTYERSAVQAWLLDAGGAAAVSPVTGHLLTSHAIRTNQAVRQLLEGLVEGRDRL
ncbi:hypothetical protein N2152v2_006775 [Parachlorella kessleri]